VKRVGVMVVLAYDVIVQEDDVALARKMGEMVVAGDLHRRGVLSFEEVPEMEPAERARWSDGVSVKDIEATDVISAPDDARADTIVCHWCKAEAPKPAWGPGYMKCPSCMKSPPSASELHALVHLPEV
jgi:hypothetical protein